MPQRSRTSEFRRSNSNSTLAIRAEGGRPKLVATEAHLVVVGRCAPGAEGNRDGIGGDTRTKEVSGLLRTTEHRTSEASVTLTDLLQDEFTSGLARQVADEVATHHGARDATDSKSTATEEPRGYHIMLRPDQLARLWLRESTLNAYNVHAWCSERGRWVPALTLAPVSQALTRARIERVRMLSLLNTARTYRPVPAPRGTRTGSTTSVRLTHRVAATRGLLASQPKEISGEFPIARRLTLASWIRGLVPPMTLRPITMVAVNSTRLAIHRQLVNWRVRIRARVATVARLLSRELREWRVYWSIQLAAIVLAGSVALSLDRLRAERHSQSDRGSDATVARTLPNVASALDLFPFHEPLVTPALHVLTKRQLRVPMSQQVHAAPPEVDEVASGPASPSLRSDTMRPFDATSIRREFDIAIQRSRQCVDADVRGRVRFTILPSGRVDSVIFESFSGTERQRSCVAAQIVEVRFTAFIGDPVSARRTFQLNAARN